MVYLNGNTNIGINCILLLLLRLHLAREIKNKESGRKCIYL